MARIMSAERRARIAKMDRVMRKEFLLLEGYNISPLRKRTNRIVNEFHQYRDKYGDSGVDYYIVNLFRMDRCADYCRRYVSDGVDYGGIEEKIEVIMEQNNINIDEYRPHYDYDCSGVCMRNEPVIRELYDGRYLVKSSWFVDC